ncbi:Os10g0130600 [Oryza sativa Japonica Group]|uniref:NBS-LRR type resistance protein n=3 Tax=Oryza TaxID=4527 RepID=Q7G6A9_ORYSJ|nr:Putative NBS-LRR type resistance protein [Oryza sativa Japonica Group]AAM47621.1 Putative NBS-LRR type resistance protein [Oryza sativa Japonica Group]AAP51988.1 NB-ARC domain containing protein [Oryza sativa Japonica Group]BAF26011.1 Os10g0130600 [Oryza sativa Japonica Group]|eukprot:NP_001064097.1 Os10g0130600 [Oryza sativa Japonica Group]
MAEYLVGPLLSKVLEKASSFLVDMYKVMDGMEDQRETLERLLPAILDVIQDAEEKKNHRSGLVCAWLKSLKKVSYEAIDVFDEFKYESLWREAKKKGHRNHTMLGMDSVSLFPSRNPIVFRYRMGKKLRKIVEKIKELVSEMNSFGLVHQQETPKQWRKTDSIMVDFDKDIVIRSRDEEKKKIIRILLDKANNTDLTVLPIVGMGGLGKTTFAQLIYNDPEIEKHFPLRRWCCVSDVFDVVTIANNICMSTERDREKALQDLQKEVGGKKYLIVLDDVWERDYDKWGKLKTCLKKGGMGSAVLTTTRDAEVARIMVTGEVEVHNLENLGEIYMKEIILRRALTLPNNDEHFGILCKIVHRCHGSPLGAKAFGSMLSTRTTMQEWNDVLTKSNICNEGEDKIFPILRLSYDDLPSHMKQCFAFCAIFPKDYEIDVETLIQLWLAHDFIPLQEEDHLETVAQNIFKELVWRSFFQDVNKISQREENVYRSQLRDRTTCKIHDLMHDISQSVMGKECLSIIGSSNLKNLMREHPLYHVLIPYTSIALPDDFMGNEAPALRTLLFRGYYGNVSTSHLFKYNSLQLRALELPRREELPIRPRHLQHLRYLNLSDNSNIHELPADISTMYNLQTLNLSDCYNLVRLPKDMKYMTSLRHLYTNGCSKLKCMPPDLGQLTSLQTLTYFIVGASASCSTLREVHSLNLSGELELRGLENVSQEQAKAANLGRKEKLTHLSLEWSGEYHAEEPDYPEKVLDALKPHHGLHMLKVVSYKGTNFPTWMTDLSVLENLTELHLEGCTMCEEFPQFIHFKFLQVLYLIKLDKLQSLCCEEARDGKVQIFPALKEVKLIDLERFESWVETEGKQENKPTFPLLEEVEISNCPKLSSLPEAPKLKVLKLNENKAELSLPLLKSRYMSQLSKLKLDVLDKEAILQLDQIHESSLSNMELRHCNFFFSTIPSEPIIGIWKWFRQLVYLEIKSSDVLIYWPEEEFLCLVSLKMLAIFGCVNLIGRTTLVKGEPTRCATDQFLPCLTSLSICCCDNLRELFVLPPSVTHIHVSGCRNFEFIWGKGDIESENVHVEHHDTFTSSEHCNDLEYRSVPEQSSSAVNHPLPCLEMIHISFNDKMVELQNLPPSLTSLEFHSCPKLQSLSGQLHALKFLDIRCCNKLESLNCLGDLPSLERLCLVSCKRLASLACGPESYSSLSTIAIRYCPAMNMKPLYERLRPRLDILKERDLSHAHAKCPYGGVIHFSLGTEHKRPTLWDPKSWKYAIPGCRWLQV